MAFLPVSDVIIGFDLVAGEFDNGADDLPMIILNKTWIGESRRRGKKLIKINFFKYFVFKELA